MSQAIVLASLALTSGAFAQPAPAPSAPDPVASAETAEPAEPPPPPLRPQHRIEYNNTLGLRYNPLGAADRLNLFYRYRLYDNPGLLYRDAGLGVGISPEITPGYGRIGPVVEIKPLTILSLRAGYHLIGHFGTFDLLQGFGSARDDFRDETQDDRSAAGLANATLGHELDVQAQFLIKAGPVVLRDTARLLVTQQNLRDDQRLFYDLRFDLLRSNGQPTVLNDVDLVYLSDFGLTAGARFHASTHLYQGADFRPGESTKDPNGPILGSARWWPIASTTWNAASAPPPSC